MEDRKEKTLFPFTSHQGFYTMEALAVIAKTTIQNFADAMEGRKTENDV